MVVTRKADVYPERQDCHHRGCWSVFQSHEVEKADVEPAGGWTVDVSTFKVSEEEPLWLLKEVVVPNGKYSRTSLLAIR